MHYKIVYDPVSNEYVLYSFESFQRVGSISEKSEYLFKTLQQIKNTEVIRKIETISENHWKFICINALDFDDESKLKVECLGNQNGMLVYELMYKRKPGRKPKAVQSEIVTSSAKVEDVQPASPQDMIEKTTKTLKETPKKKHSKKRRK